jgi:hypothetical protein
MVADHLSGPTAQLKSFSLSCTSMHGVFGAHDLTKEQEVMMGHLNV